MDGLADYIEGCGRLQQVVDHGRVDLFGRQTVVGWKVVADPLREDAEEAEYLVTGVRGELAPA